MTFHLLFGFRCGYHVFCCPVVAALTCFVVCLLQLPLDVQQRVKVHLTRDEILRMDGDFDSSSSDAPAPQQRVIRVPMPTFPPTAMVYSVPRNNSESQLSAAAAAAEVANQSGGVSVPTDLIAKVLLPAASKHKASRYYVCSRCRAEFNRCDVSTQTLASGGGCGGGHDSNHFVRTVLANMSTNPPTIIPHYPGVHSPTSRLDSCSSDISPPS